MSRDLPSRPNLDHLKKQAKELLHSFERREPAAVERFHAVASTSTARPKLADAQHVIAHEYGFPSWAKLKQHVESLAHPSDPLKAWTEAIKANQADRVAELLRDHRELKSKLNDPLPGFGFGCTALFGAVERSNQKMIEILLQAGADINQRTHWWAGTFGVLDEAAHRDRAPWLAPFLIERGALVDVHAAVQLSMLEKLKEMLSANPDLVHARGGDGQTPLHFAPTVPIAEYLLDHGADINARDIDHESTPAQYMVRDRPAVARYLVKRGCQTDILLAAALGDSELVRKHLEADPACLRMSVSEEYFPKQDSRAGGTIYIWTLGWHRTAHLLAHEFGHPEALRLLMESSPAELKLAVACELGDRESLRTLLSDHPNLVQTLSDDDRSRLVWAAQNNNNHGVALMLEAGWPVGVRGQDGATSLHWAGFHGNPEMVRELLRHQAPLETRDQNYDGAPLDWAIYGSVHGWQRGKGDYAGVVETLLQAGARAPELSEELEASEPVRAVLRRYAEREGR
jgi:ankyrin repeat protein